MNIGLAFFLVGPLKAPGIALALAGASAVNSLVLVIALIRARIPGASKALAAAGRYSVKLLLISGLAALPVFCSPSAITERPPRLLECQPRRRYLLDGYVRGLRRSGHRFFGDIAGDAMAEGPGLLLSGGDDRDGRMQFSCLHLLDFGPQLDEARGGCYVSGASQYALVAQLAEHIHGKDKVNGSIPFEG